MKEIRLTARTVDYERWYDELVQAAELAEPALVPGCMVIRPYGFAIWELIRATLDAMIKTTGHENAYFPLLIPQGLLKKEKDHVKGFAPECAVVTRGGQHELSEPLVIRPTSEAIINSTFSSWIKSWKDLPLLINQWANVVRWETEPKMFLRTTEFLWQEGHTAHETREEAEEETLKMLLVYKSLLENTLAIPVVDGLKTEWEKFKGAERTYTIEALLQNLKAVQAGTSHYLGQKFAKAFNIVFTGRCGKKELVYQTSWGVSTRLIGVLILAHSDDRGLVLPPKAAPYQVVVVPSYRDEEQRKRVYQETDRMRRELDKEIRLLVDLREHLSQEEKMREWEVKGVPICVLLGPAELERQRATLVRRDTGLKYEVHRFAVRDELLNLLRDIQIDLFRRARRFREEHTFLVDKYDNFRRQLEDEGGWYYAHWCGHQHCELRLHRELEASIRVIPLNNPPESGSCLLCGKPSQERVYIARQL